MTTPGNPNTPFGPTVPVTQSAASPKRPKPEGNMDSSMSSSAAPPDSSGGQQTAANISNGTAVSSAGNGEPKMNAVMVSTAASTMATVTFTTASTTTSASSVPLKVPSVPRQIRPTGTSTPTPTLQIRPSPQPASRPIPIASRPPTTSQAPSSNQHLGQLITSQHRFSTADSALNGVPVQPLVSSAALVGTPMQGMPLAINMVSRGPSAQMMRPRMPMSQGGAMRPNQALPIQMQGSPSSLPLQSRPSLLPQGAVRPATPISAPAGTHSTLLGMPMGMMLPTTIAHMAQNPTPTPLSAHSQVAGTKTLIAPAQNKTASPSPKQSPSPAHSQPSSMSPNQPSGSRANPPIAPHQGPPSSPLAKSPAPMSPQSNIIGKLPLPATHPQQLAVMGRPGPVTFAIASRPPSVAVSLASKPTQGLVSSIPLSSANMVPIVSKPAGSLGPGSLPSRPTLVATPMNVTIAGGQTVTVLTQASLPMGANLTGGTMPGSLFIASNPVNVSLPQPPPLLPIVPTTTTTIAATNSASTNSVSASSISQPKTSQPPTTTTTTMTKLPDGIPAASSGAASKEKDGKDAPEQQADAPATSIAATAPSLSEPAAADVSKVVVKTEKPPSEGTPSQEGSDFDAVKALKWENGIGHLPGSDLRFRINDLGMIEMVEDLPGAETGSSTCAAGTPASSGPYVGPILTDDPNALMPVDGDKVAQCESCHKYGYASFFLGTSRFCSQACVGIHAGRKNATKKAMQGKPLHSLKKRKKSSIGASSVDEEDGMGPSSAKMSKVESFSWVTYLTDQKAVGAPVKLFKEPFPQVARNGFKKGMKLEGVDPSHQSLYCVLTVAEVMSYRIRLHFDGYSECYDFWVNADSPFIFPAGWCEKNNKKLTPPKQFVQSGEPFTWAVWMKNSKGTIAPKNLFVNQPATSVTPNAFRVGMKLEAVDKKNSSLICVATVNDILGDKVLIHFDGWDNSYDYWCDITSPYIHHVGWCQENGHPLSPPADWTEVETFTWEDYLSQTKSSAVPARAFKPRPPVGFGVGQKLEVVDKRNPILVRVATIADVQGHRIQIHFDGWSSAYDYWLDDDSPDIHPPGWCSRTGHELQPPITPGETTNSRSSQSGCPTPGCRGIGHIKGAKYTGHHSDFGCPYSATNMNKETTLQDRLGASRNDDGLTPSGTVRVKREFSISPEFSDAENTSSSGAHSHLAVQQWSNPPEKRKRGRPKSSWRKAMEEKSRMVSPGINWNEKCPTPGCNGEGHITGRFTAHHRLSGCPLAEPQPIKLKPFGSGRGRKRSRFLSGNDVRCDAEERDRGEDSHSSEISGYENAAHLQNGIHQSVFMSAIAPHPSRELSLCWEQHSKLLPEVAETTGAEVAAWSIQDVANFIQTLPGCQDQARLFAEEQIDGEAFLLLNQSDIVKIMNIKLGPALKIFNSILMFRNTMEC